MITPPMLRWSSCFENVLKYQELAHLSRRRDLHQPFNLPVRLRNHLGNHSPSGLGIHRSIDLASDIPGSCAIEAVLEWSVGWWGRVRRRRVDGMVALLLDQVLDGLADELSGYGLGGIRDDRSGGLSVRLAGTIWGGDGGDGPCSLCCVWMFQGVAGVSSLRDGRLR